MIQIFALLLAVGLAGAGFLCLIVSLYYSGADEREEWEP